MDQEIRVRRIGITGGIACGKSTVTDMLRKMGFTVLDADALYHQLIGKEGTLLRSLVEYFGTSILTAEGTLDRKKLGEHVFSRESEREKLDQLTHPAVYHALEHLAKETIQQWIRADLFENEEESDKHRLLFFDVPLLIESLAASRVLCLDSIWLVTASDEERKRRLMMRDGLSRKAAEQRISAQMSEEEKRKKASVILNNDADLVKLKKIVEEAVRGELYA